MTDSTSKVYTEEAVPQLSPNDQLVARKRNVVDVHCEPLLAVCTPDVYRYNAFRITGLAVDASPREIKRRIDELKAADEMGDAADEHTHAFALKPPPAIEQIREAAQRLDDPEKRIVDEFFWFWPENGGAGKADTLVAHLLKGDEDAAIALLQKFVPADASDERLSELKLSVPTVAMHNLAVLFHLMALDLERKTLQGSTDANLQKSIDQYWRKSFFWWEAITDDETFWSLVTERIRMLDDPRATTGFARRLRASLPYALDKINAMLALAFIEKGEHEPAVQHLRYMLDTHKGQDDVVGTLNLVSEPLVIRLRTAINHAEKSGTGSPASANGAAADLLKVASEPIRILKQFLADGDHLLVDICDSVASACLHCNRTVAQHTNTTQQQWDDAIMNLTKALAVAESVEIKSSLKLALTNARRDRQYSHPRAKQILALILRAKGEGLKQQLETYGNEIASLLTEIKAEVGHDSTYKECANVVSVALRELSISIINDAQFELSKVARDIERFNSYY